MQRESHSLCNTYELHLTSTLFLPNLHPPLLHVTFLLTVLCLWPKVPCPAV